jgi:2'-5' RNA ligase
VETGCIPVVTSVDREPFITDPRHLSAVAGSSFLVLRPPERVRAAYAEVQAAVRDRAEGRGSYPAPHVTICGFPQPASAAEASIVSEWAERTRPLRVAAADVSAFPAIKTVIVVVEDDPDLRAAAASVRAVSTDVGLPVYDEIPVADWIFHMSVAYLDDMTDGEWDAFVPGLAALAVRSVGGTVGTAELVTFDGGPERLAAAFVLAGA